MLLLKEGIVMTIKIIRHAHTPNQEQPR